MRLFIAIDFPEETKDEIVTSMESLRKQFPQVAWTKKENIHLTVKFLGNINEKREALSEKCKDEEELLDKIKKGIEKSSVGIKLFELVFERVGCFEKDQLIIWLGAKTTSQLELLVRQLDIEMGKLGFIKERKEFTPHITVGRGKRLDQQILQGIKQVINTEQFILPKPFTVSAIHLMDSTLTPKGPNYTLVSQFALS